MNDNIIYGLYCPIKNTPVYVGQSKNDLKRPFEHIKDKSHNSKVKEWVSLLKSSGYSPVLVILESNFPSEFTNDKEHFWIQKFLSEGKLLFNQQLVTPMYVLNIDLNKIQVDHTDSLADIRLFIRTKRREMNLTQEQLADYAGVALTVIRKIEQKNSKGGLALNSLIQVLNLFDVDLTIKSKPRKY